MKGRKSMKFYYCAHCGNIVVYVRDVGVPVKCCGENMKELVPGTTDAAQEKHVPLVKVEDNMVIVSVGEVEHPMAEEHFIQWVILETDQGWQRKELKPGTKPKAVFALAPGERAVAAYEYCNLHGLWKTEIR